MWMPDVASVTAVHDGLVQLFVDEDDPISPSGIKSPAMLESACARPHTGAGNIDKYGTLDLKLAALFHSLTKNHPFHNGNKRTATVSLLTALHRNDRRLTASVTDDIIFDFVVAVTANEFPKANHGLDVDDVVTEIASWIKANSVTTAVEIPTMKAKQFLSRCEQAGATVKASKSGAYIISFNGNSIRFSRSTRQLDGAVVRTYLRRLRLNEVESGLCVNEFQEGANGEKEQIFRFIAALKRLAKT